MLAMGVSCWAEFGQSRPSDISEHPQGSDAEILGLGTYMPVFVAVTVRIHSVIPVKERVLDVLFQVQSPDFFATA